MDRTCIGEGRCVNARARDGAYSLILCRYFDSPEFGCNHPAGPMTKPVIVHIPAPPAAPDDARVARLARAMAVMQRYAVKLSEEFRGTTWEKLVGEILAAADGEGSDGVER
jgi:hypothetical protein